MNVPFKITHVYLRVSRKTCFSRKDHTMPSIAMFHSRYVDRGCQMSLTEIDSLLIPFNLAFNDASARPGQESYSIFNAPFFLTSNTKFPFFSPLENVCL